VSATIAIVVVSLVYVIDWYNDSPRQDWAGAAAYVLQRSSSSDGIVMCGHRTGFEYYVLQRDRGSAPVPLSPKDRWQRGYHNSTYDRARAYPPRVWLVSEGNDTDRRQCARGNALANRTMTASAKYAGVRVAAYDA
jgi:hypothetical protein